MAIWLYYGEFQHYSNCENWVAEALDRNGHHCLRVQRRSRFSLESLLEIAAMAKVTHVLTSKTPEIAPEDIRRLKEAGLKVLMWTFDWMANPINWEWFGPRAKECDMVFMTDGMDADRFYENAGIRRVELHQGCVPGLHEPLQDVEGLPYPLTAYSADIAFIGKTYTARRRELVYMLERLPYRFRKWGEPSSDVWGKEFAAACSMSKIVVGDNFVNDVPGYWSDRVYLSLGCGAFFMTAYVPGLEREFENHKHLVWWNDFDDLVKQVEYYLPREAERKMIARQGCRLVHQEHTYDRRIQKLTRELGAR